MAFRNVDHRVKVAAVNRIAAAVPAQAAVVHGKPAAALVIAAIVEVRTMIIMVVTMIEVVAAPAPA